MNQVTWATPWHGLEALLNGRNLALGLAVLFLARSNGLLYIINSVDDPELRSISARKLIVNSAVFLVFFLFFAATLLISDGFAIRPETGEIVMERFKYLHNLIEMPHASIPFLCGVILVLYGLFTTVFRASTRGIWFSGSGTVLVVFALFLIAGLNMTSFYPSAWDLQSSLTIFTASSSLFTLKTMMFVSFIVPAVVAYIWYAWKAINNKPVTEAELNEEEHKY
jgi:cytochrome d ubiquinol oxidase subunit II